MTKSKRAGLWERYTGESGASWWKHLWDTMSAIQQIADQGPPDVLCQIQHDEDLIKVLRGIHDELWTLNKERAIAAKFPRKG